MNEQVGHEKEYIEIEKIRKIFAFLVFIVIFAKQI